MKQLWLSLMAATFVVAPLTVAQAQDAGAETPSAAADDDNAGIDDGAAGGAAAPADGADDDDAPAGAAAAADDDDDGGDDDASTSGDLVPTADELTIPPGSEMMPASALNGDQLGLPPVSLSAQVIPPLILGSPDGEYDVSHTDIYLRAGQAYTWDIASEGNLEYKWHSPGFFRNSWMNQLVINDLEIHMAGAPAWLEYDGQGAITVRFSTIRPGRYEWYVQDLEDEGMRGTITIVP